MIAHLSRLLIWCFVLCVFAASSLAAIGIWSQRGQSLDEVTARLERYDALQRRLAIGEGISHRAPHGAVLINQVKEESPKPADTERQVQKIVEDLEPFRIARGNEFKQEKAKGELIQKYKGKKIALVIVINNIQSLPAARQRAEPGPYAYLYPKLPIYQDGERTVTIRRVTTERGDTNDFLFEVPATDFIKNLEPGTPVAVRGVIDQLKVTQRMSIREDGARTYPVLLTIHLKDISVGPAK